MKDLETFSEISYRSMYPDVDQAILRGHVLSAYSHYVQAGEHEGREFPLESRSVSELFERVLQLEKKYEERQIYDNICHISKKYPKSPVVIFYTPRAFEGNLKYTFLNYIQATRDGTGFGECYFLTTETQTYDMLRSLQLPCLLWEGRGESVLETVLSAAILVDDGFYTDGNLTPSLLYASLSGALRVNLWHGTPIIKIFLQEIACVKRLDIHSSMIYKSAVDNDVFCGASKIEEYLFRQAMCFKRFVVTGYARNDVFYRDLLDNDLVNVDLPLYSWLSDSSRKERVVFYAPTWRFSRPDWIREIDLLGLASSLAAQGVKLVVNLHPFEMERHLDWLEKIHGIILVKPRTDIYPLLKHVDVLVTDYSSIAFDYLHTRRPILMFRPDHNDYLSDNRELIHERLDRLGASVAERLEVCVDRILHLLEFPEGCAEKIGRALASSHDYQDGMSSGRCSALLKSLMEERFSGRYI